MSSGSEARIDTDVLVVGAGPGGSAAAYHLARHGIDVTLVEKAAFPREKVCGDGITPRGVRALWSMGIDTDDAAFERVIGLRVYSREATIEIPWPQLDSFPDFGLVMTRMSMDELLARRAQAAGARLHERTEAVRPRTDNDRVVGAVVRSVEDGAETQVHAKMVIACDGAASRFGQHVGVRRDDTRPMGIAARRYFRIERHPGPWLESWLDLWEGDVLLPGYGWLFPVPDGTVNLGAGLLNTFKDFRSVSAQRLFDAFARMLPEAWGIREQTAEGPVRSGPLPMGMNRTPAAVPGMLLAGDAAGIVNPFNGEGITYAMESAQVAAELVTESLEHGRPAIAQMYPTVLHERYGSYFRLGRGFARLIGHPAIMRAATRYGVPRPLVMNFAMRMLGNLTDGGTADVNDKLFSAVERLARVS
jgi:menaquinone-9 beta-reductase